MSNDNKPTNVEKIYAFDTLYTTNHIQMLKILLPCLNPPLQKTLALYIKFLELCYTFSFLKAHPNGIKGCGFDKPPTDWQIISDELLPYLSPEEAERIRQMKQAFQMMKQFESMQSMMEKLDGILPENMNFQDLFNQMANQNKSIETGLSQMRDIELIIEKKGIKFLNENLRKVAECRLESTEASLAEIAEMMDPPLSKSGVNHRMKKIHEIAEEIRRSYGIEE